MVSRNNMYQNILEEITHFHNVLIIVVITRSSNGYYQSFNDCYGLRNGGINFPICY